MTTRKINGATAVAAEQQALAIVNDPIGEIFSTAGAAAPLRR